MCIRKMSENCKKEIANNIARVERYNIEHPFSQNSHISLPGNVTPYEMNPFYYEAHMRFECGYDAYRVFGVLANLFDTTGVFLANVLDFHASRCGVFQDTDCRLIVDSRLTIEDMRAILATFQNSALVNCHVAIESLDYKDSQIPGWKKTEPDPLLVETWTERLNTWGKADWNERFYRRYID